MMTTLDEALDGKRLRVLRNRILDLMLDGRWRTLAEIQAQCGGAETGVSAKLRDLRKFEFGAYTVDRRRRGNPASGLWEYRVEALSYREACTKLCLPGTERRCAHG
jgi:hypothetical protein